MLLIWLLIVLLSLWIFARRLFPYLIARIVSLFLKDAKFRIGGFGWRRLQLQKTRLRIKNINLHVADLRLTSSIFSGEASNLITIIATEVSLDVYQPTPRIQDDAGPKEKSRNSRTLLLLAQFLGIQLRDVRVNVHHLPSLADCRLEIQLGELRLDSSVIHRTKLSLALYLYQGNVVLKHVSQGPLLETSFAFQASIQALAHSGKISSVEDVNLDIDGLSLQLYSSLFHCTLPVSSNPPSPSTSSKSSSSLTSFLPKAAQVKAECCSVVLEHSDKSSQLTGSLALLYMCVKCADPQRAGLHGVTGHESGVSPLPDSHLTGQVSGLRVWANDNQDDRVVSLSKFQVLVQKEAITLRTDTQIHELTARGSSVLLPWMDPVSWLVKTVESRRQSTNKSPVANQGSVLSGLTHRHQLDAWNSEVCLEFDGKERWKLALHQVNISSTPVQGLTPSEISLCIRQARLSVREVETVLSLGQFDARKMEGSNGNSQVDILVNGASLCYTPALVSLVTDVKECLRPLVMVSAKQSPAKMATKHFPAIEVTQSRLAWSNGAGHGLVLELRELYGKQGYTSVSGLKMLCVSKQQDDMSLLSLPHLKVTKTDSEEVKVILKERVKVCWQPSVHVLATKCVEDIMKLISLAAPPNHKIQEPPNTQKVVYINLEEKLTIQVTVGDNVAKASLSSLTAKYAGINNVSWIKAPRGKLKLNKNEILSLDDINVKGAPKSEKLSSERRRMEGVLLEQNKCIAVSIKKFCFTQPYQFNFYDVVLQELVGVFKWLKIHHKRTSNTESNNLPRDILINIQHFVFELADDPFEVRLRDNYVLKEEEYLESQKRLQIFGQKIEEKRKQNLMFPKEKIEELLTNLSKKNAEIYVQRAKKLFSKVSRTRLFECNLGCLEISILSDPSMHGRDNILNMMYDSDPQSPWPDPSSLSFTTLWCRWVKFEAEFITFHLRDFPQHLLDIKRLLLWGKLAGAETEPGRRATRGHVVKMGHGFDDVRIERGMTPLKFFYQLACDVESWSMAYGLCWEPALTQCSLALNFLTGHSHDPSPPLPWWDKTRLVLHGRLLLASKETQILLHASLDPYNTTEEMDFSFSDMELDWEDGVIKMNGTMDVFVRTASKYDDFQLLHIPGMSLTVKMEWSCLANPLDHHSVMPCAPDKLPEYSINQEHDSYRAFRSKHLNISVGLETRPGRDRPRMDMFSSTLRWFENLKFIFSCASRPIRRGAVFNNNRLKKPQLSRHFKRVGLSVFLHQFQVNYWTSFSQQKGLLLNIARGINLSTEHLVCLVPYKDGLKRRPRADWTVQFINSELATSDIWIQTALPPETDQSEAETPETPATPVSSRDTMGSTKSELPRNMERSFFFCVEKVVYMRMGQGLKEEAGKPTHKLVIHGARGAWTQSNRDMFFALYESWRRAQIIRKNVSSDALKLIHCDPINKPEDKSQGQVMSPFSSPTSAGATGQATGSPFSWSMGNQGPRSGLSLMDRLLQEADGGATPTAYSEDMSGQEEVKHSLEAMVACTLEDVLHRNWCIELVNSQVLLKGIETKGYVIISAARATVTQNMCKPVWRDKTLLSKTTWSGGLETMQYYATVGEEGADLDNIQWLTLDNIGETDDHNTTRIPGPAGLVGSGRAVGGVVSQVVGVTDSPGDGGIQLQRIVSRCKAEFFYVSYGDTELESVEMAGHKYQGATKLGGDGMWSDQETAVNAFSFVHHDLNASTNSLQYAMLLDIANNLLLYQDEGIKERTDRYLRMRYLFMLELDNIEEQRKRIIRSQNELRQLVCKLRQSERDIYMLQDREMMSDKRLRLEMEQEDIKDKLSATSEDLDMRIRCYRETQMSASQKNVLRGEDTAVRLRRRAEIVFSKAVWRLTEIDGQLGIADINISNFLFTRSSMSDDTVENLLEMGYVNVKNLLPNQLYTDCLSPTELRDMPLDRQRTVRVFSKERPRVGGISVRDHFEINIAPLTLAITANFYKRMMNFAFPEKDADTLEDDYEVDKKSRKQKRKARAASTSFYVPSPDRDKDDVEKMKERAEKNKLFIYIKIPEVPIKVSYKGEKEKNQILDVADFQLQVPTLEYHNVTWTWLDLLLAVKGRSRDSLIAQALKQKIFKRGFKSEEQHHENSEEEKARLLLGKQFGTPGGSVRSSRRFLSIKK